MRTYMSKMTTDAIGYNIPPEGGKFLEVTEVEARNQHLGIAIRLDSANIYQFATPNFAKAWEMRPPTTRAICGKVEPVCVYLTRDALLTALGNHETSLFSIRRN